MSVARSPVITRSNSKTGASGTHGPLPVKSEEELANSGAATPKLQFSEQDPTASLVHQHSVSLKAIEETLAKLSCNMARSRNSSRSRSRHSSKHQRDPPSSSSSDCESESRGHTHVSKSRSNHIKYKMPKNFGGKHAETETFLFSVKTF